MAGPASNWARNVEFSAVQTYRPQTVAELQELISANTHARAIGTGHSFSPIADTPGALVSLAGMPPVMNISPDRATVTVSAGIRYGELARHLPRPASRCPTWRHCRTCRSPAPARPLPMAPVTPTATWPPQSRR